MSQIHVRAPQERRARQVPVWAKASRGELKFAGTWNHAGSLAEELIALEPITDRARLDAQAAARVTIT
jgi:hypothetical protein